MRQTERNIAWCNKIFIFGAILVSNGYTVTPDGKSSKKTIQAAQKYSGSSTTSIDELYEAVKAKKEGER